eukprot:ANDGO_04541.mRNA.1 hypothetical protein
MTDVNSYQTSAYVNRRTTRHTIDRHKSLLAAVSQVPKHWFETETSTSSGTRGRVAHWERVFVDLRPGDRSCRLRIRKWVKTSGPSSRIIATRIIDTHLERQQQLREKQKKERAEAENEDEVEAEAEVEGGKDKEETEVEKEREGEEEEEEEDGEAEGEDEEEQQEQDPGLEQGLEQEEEEDVPSRMIDGQEEEEAANGEINEDDSVSRQLDFETN